ncbi:MAG: peptidylprolyl isomerase [Bacteroidales bacterium]|nr:peptidylprolyl isomerase [Bacteroidales bacterium]
MQTKTQKYSVLSRLGLLILLLLSLDMPANAQKEQKNMQTTNTLVLISTSLGDIKVRLYDETPLHRDNFIKLVKEGYYDGLLFHRVIDNFMIQGGDPDSRDAAPGTMLGKGGPDYTIPAEITPDLKHKKGALAAARMGDNVNPQRASSGSQFYIVQNDKGTPHLDGAYTVFGETVEGLDVVDKIAKVATDRFNRPIEDVRIISMKIVKK